MGYLLYFVVLSMIPKQWAQIKTISPPGESEYDFLIVFSPRLQDQIKNQQQQPTTKLCWAFLCNEKSSIYGNKRKPEDVTFVKTKFQRNSPTGCLRFFTSQFFFVPFFLLIGKWNPLSVSEFYQQTNTMDEAVITSPAGLNSFEFEPQCHFSFGRRERLPHVKKGNA